MRLPISSSALYYFLLCIGLLAAISSAKAQNTVGIGTENPNNNAVLHLTSPGNNQGLLVPSLTTSQRISTSFTDNLSLTDNGLLVFDLTEKQFYFWQDTEWKNLNTDSQLLAGSGIEIVNNTISNTGDIDPSNEIQDLNLLGNTLSITNNSTATEIDLSPFSGTNTDNQDLSSTSAGTNRTIRITGGNNTTISVADNDNSTTNEIQNLGNVLSTGNNAGGNRISNLGNPTATGDAASRQYVDNNIFSGNFGDLAGVPSGLADGDDVGLTLVTSNTSLAGNGTTTSPLSIANNAITTTRIANLAVVEQKIANGAITNIKLGNGAVNNLKIANGAVSNSKITDMAPSKLQAAGAATGQALIWNGSNWIPQTIPSGGSNFSTNNRIPRGNGTTLVVSSIFDNGSVGINNTSPSADFDVNGAVELNGPFSTPADVAFIDIKDNNVILDAPKTRIIRIRGRRGESTIRGIARGSDGQEIIIINTGSDPIIVVGAASPGKEDSLILEESGVSLDSFGSLHLIYDLTIGSGAWIEVGRSPK